MKNLVPYLFSFIFLISCNAEPVGVQANDPVDAVYKDNDIVPFNSSNPYENAGRVYDQLFEAYYENQYLPATVTTTCGRVEATANANVAFVSLKDAASQPPVPVKVDYIAQHQASCINDMVTASTLSAPAKTSLSGFENDFVLFFKNEYNSEVLYAYVAAYENTIISNQAFAENDKRIILTATSIIRHTAYLARKKPKKNTDPDWTVLVGNIAGATQGAEEGQAKAVTMALATGITTN